MREVITLLHSRLKSNFSVGELLRLHPPRSGSRWWVIGVPIMTVVCFISFVVPNAQAQSRTMAPPLMYLSSCEIDLNGDSESDVVLLVDTSRGRELIVLLHSAEGYAARVLSTGKEHSILTCNYGATVTETKSGQGKGRVFKTSGTYVELTQPESSSIAFFWTKEGFKEVWTSD